MSELNPRRTIFYSLTGDSERATDILDEIQAVCRKCGYILASTDKGIMLAKYEQPPKPCRIIAVVRQITPNLYEYMPASGDLHDRMIQVGK